MFYALTLMHILNASQTAQVLPYTKLVPAVAQAALDLHDGSIVAPERLVLSMTDSSTLLCMPALGADIGVTKLITVHKDNAQHSLPAIQGEVIIFEKQTGRRLALLDGPTVTARRTAAVTLLGIQRLMPLKPASVIVIGTGVQAAAHVGALVEYFGVTSVRIASRDPAKAQAFCNALGAQYPHTKISLIGLDNLRHECESANVVIAATTSKTPVIPAELPRHTLAVGVGAFKPDMAEIPPALLRARSIVVDHLAGARREAGDLIQAGIDWDKVRDLSEVVREGRDWDADNAVMPVLKTVGHAAWDLAAARVALQSL
jgi:1-piperideine-2-carboxylate/1-pyrroline-2-carboxylate reductase [NAD(P)H]